MSKKQEDDCIRVRTTPPFKLKDRPNRQYQGINLRKQFGFLPEIIIIEKIVGHHNTMIVRAVLTPEEIEKENSLLIKKENDGKPKSGSK